MSAVPDPPAAMVGVDKDHRPPSRAMQTRLCMLWPTPLPSRSATSNRCEFELQLRSQSPIELVPAILRLDAAAHVGGVGRRHEVNRESHDFRMPRVKNALRAMRSHEARPRKIVDNSALAPSPLRPQRVLSDIGRRSLARCEMWKVGVILMQRQYRSGRAARRQTSARTEAFIQHLVHWPRLCRALSTSDRHEQC